MEQLPKVLHTYTVMKKNFAIINYLTWQEARDLTDKGDLILTIKDNYVTAVRKVSVYAEYDNEEYKQFDHVAKSITYN